MSARADGSTKANGSLMEGLASPVSCPRRNIDHPRFGKIPRLTLAGVQTRGNGTDHLWVSQATGYARRNQSGLDRGPVDRAGPHQCSEREGGLVQPLIAAAFRSSDDSAELALDCRLDIAVSRFFDAQDRTAGREWLRRGQQVCKPPRRQGQLGFVWMSIGIPPINAALRMNARLYQNVSAFTARIETGPELSRGVPDRDLAPEQ